MSDNYPSIAIALQEIGDSILKSKATFGTPATLAETHAGLLEGYMRGVVFGGRPIIPLDSYALDALNALSILATSPRKEAFHALAAAGILGAAHVIAVEARQAGSEAQEAPQGPFEVPEEPAEADDYDPDSSAAVDWDERTPDDLLDTAKATAAERESFRADMGRPSHALGSRQYRPALIVEPGTMPEPDQMPGTLVYQWRRGAENALIGYIGAQGRFTDMSLHSDRPGYTDVVAKLAATEAELAEAYLKFKMG